MQPVGRCRRVSGQQPLLASERYGPRRHGHEAGPESVWFNPAAAAFQQSKFDISFGVTGIAAKATYTSLPDYRGGELSRAVSDNKISTPLYFYANYKPTEWMSVGLAFNTPFGSSMNWGNDWQGPT